MTNYREMTIDGDTSPSRVVGLEIRFRTYEGEQRTGRVERMEGLYPVIRFADDTWARGDARMEVVTTREAQDHADRIWPEIIADALGGIIPADVTDFSQLHDHVDANDYLTDVPVGETGDTETDIALVIEVTEILHARLVAGLLARDVAVANA